MNCIKCKHIVILPKDGSTYCINCNAFYRKISLFNKQFNTFETTHIVLSIVGNIAICISISKSGIFRLGEYNNKHLTGFTINYKPHNLILKKDEDFIELIELNYKEYLSYINNLIFE